MEAVLRIIDDYREAPCLWNRKHADYRDTGERKREWQRLGRKHNMSELKMEKKIHNLRTQFTRELKILRDSKKNNTPLKKRIWFGYHKMLFLVEDENERKKMETWDQPWSDDSCEMDSDVDTLNTDTIETIKCDPDKDTVSDDFDLNFDDIIASNVVNAVSSNLIPIDEPANSPRPAEGSVDSQGASITSTLADESQTVRSTTKRAATELLDQGTGSGKRAKETVPRCDEFERTGSSKRMRETVPRWDEFDAYGEYVGHKLRNSNKSRVEIAVAQRDIEDVFIRLEVGAYAVPEAQGKHKV
uniref:MADF domain-containing protein n=1 Tax=Anopheles atroparvus TaxID=41427 RepID=A0A182JHN1_ANOAO